MIPSLWFRWCINIHLNTNMDAPKLDLLPLKKRDRTNENFEKVRENIMRRCNEISHRYQTDVYITLRRKHKHYEYSSTDDPSWPISRADMERVYPVPLRKTPANFVRHRSRATKAHLHIVKSTSGVEKLKVCAGEDSTPSGFVGVNTGVIGLQGAAVNESLPLA
ncbi:hypothetical protein BDP55DRAFT_686865 [Colletotrichum godetiae]|uniref:Uncharacterized protein n=1 Tax=Colletotrichum godetiae TaxID=1209918 RepID=A0AAJ0EL28_9PEZI|nr:uncharacterized protein BDP55DRAFT_686865 [Colletotrichum godetiae]KAK1657060.1 hypothetical protein BDP55DRAFT_686865 [Colletotrichum godetiae]